MKLEMMAVKDRALDAFMRPFFAQTVNQAIRMFQDEINNPQGDMFKHVDDHDLWHLGTWDDNTGYMAQEPNSSEQTVIKQVAIGKNMKVTA